MLRLLVLVIAGLVVGSAQDQSRAIQAQQQREAVERGEQQRRELIRQEHRREAQAREEQELAARRRAEAQAEQQRQRQEPEIQSPQPAFHPLAGPSKKDQEPAPADSNGAGFVNSRRLELRVIGGALMAFSALSILGIAIHYGIRRT